MGKDNGHGATSLGLTPKAAANRAIQKAVAQHAGDREDPPLPYLEPAARRAVREFILKGLRLLRDNAGVRHIPDKGKAGLVAIAAASLGWEVGVVEMDRPQKGEREYAVVRGDTQEMRRRRDEPIIQPEDFD